MNNMTYPIFFKNTPTITLRDPLSNFLGTFEDGIVEFTYLDIVKSAGHSCPTVSGAYLVTIKALKLLYPNEIPTRGAIEVSLKGDMKQGVIGVISNVITQITGATELSGFKGLNGKFARNNLMHFNADIDGEIEFKRVDNGKKVTLNYDPSCVKGNPKQQELMMKLMQGIATPLESIEFGKLWQERVENIFKRADEVITISK
jgi:hypothetical protein